MRNRERVRRAIYHVQQNTPRPDSRVIAAINDMTPKMLSFANAVRQHKYEKDYIYSDIRRQLNESIRKGSQDNLVIQDRRHRGGIQVDLRRALSRVSLR